ncbi:hypothetical protein ABIE65_005145 [Constrictibacter sp. MBR-5]|jgi:hypothetical protein
MTVWVQPVPALSARRRRKKSDALVIADCLDIEATPARKLADAEIPLCHPEIPS